MSAQHYRALIAVANVLLLALISVVGLRSFTGSKPGAGEVPPDNFQPLQFEIPFNTGPRSSIREYVVIWQQLDRPKPRRVALPNAGNRPIKPRVSDLASMYTLLMANYSPENEDSSTVIIQKGPSSQITLAVGDKLPDGYEVSRIVVRGRGDAREAILTFTRSGKSQSITLKRAQNK